MDLSFPLDIILKQLIWIYNKIARELDSFSFNLRLYGNANWKVFSGYMGAHPYN